MTTSDLYSVQFWWYTAAVVVLVGPLKGPRVRPWALALANLGFLSLTMAGATLNVALAALVAWLVLRLVAGRAGGFALAGGSVAVLGLFVAHKLPALSAEAGTSAFNPYLTAVGFSYVALRWIDVARAVREGRRPPPGPAQTINYLLPFHMLTAGPIQAYDDFVDQPAVPAPLDAEGAMSALERIASGMFKKYVLANILESVFLTGFRSSGPYYLLEVQLNFLWLFLDFSAYSDIAVGIGQLIGVATPENFNRPYLARNIIEFWDRWHMSLSGFIRRNVFIPVQLHLMRGTGGRSPLVVASAAFLVSFLLCGLWHSISLGWLAWGLYQAAGLIACNVYKHALQARLGRKGVARYLANPWVRAAGIVLTFEFSAFALVVATYPYEELLRWTTGYLR